METEELKLKKAIREVFEKTLEEKKSEGKIESKVTFEDIMNDKEKFLEIFSPWHGTNGKQLIKTFVDKVQNNSDDKFSWFDILNEDLRWKNLVNNKRKNEVEGESKHVNMRYQIPIHFHGNIDDAVIFHCMENPKGYLEKENFSVNSINLEYFYKKSAKDRNEKNQNNSILEILKERHRLTDFDVDKLTNIIYSEESNLLQELKDIFEKKEVDPFFTEEYIFKSNKKSKKILFPYYYIANYYNQLLDMKSDKIFEFKNDFGNRQTEALNIAKKICNIEIYPFSCKDPQLGNGQTGETILLNSDLSRLGVYVVLRRIYKYLQDKEIKQDNQKPVIVFRKYISPKKENRAWRKLLYEIFTEEILNIIEKNFIYCQTANSGNGITSGNVISVSHYKEYLESKKNKSKNNSDLEKDYKDWKKEAFDKITNDLPRIVDERENNKA